MSVRMAIGWALVHSLWEGALIAGLLAAVLWPLRSARSRYLTACAALLLMLVSFGATLGCMWPEPARLATAPPVVAIPLSSPPAGIPAQWEPALSALVPWLAPVWIAVVSALYLHQFAGFLAVYRLRRRSVCRVPDAWQREVARLGARIRVSRPVLLIESCLAETPVLVGHVRPLIVLPIGLLSGLPTGQIEAILLHELAHVRRHDYLVNALQRLIEGLFFYHPAVWWISHAIRTERENCCDDLVVATRGRAPEYAAALSALEHNRAAGRNPAIAATGGSLVKRIRRLLIPQTPNGSWTPLVAGLVLVAAFLSTLAARPANPPQSAHAAYANWLDEDVVYIIDDAERAAFLKLTTDEERDRFVAQFWERRNPNPGSSENAFKEEHYRRIAYANNHWSTSVPGWRTDRGHMYIAFGPPDEIESHPSPSDGKMPFEQWMYHDIPGVGTRVVLTFVDRTGRGDYRLAPGSTIKLPIERPAPRIERIKGIAQLPASPGRVPM